jgi:methionyl-tRNA formyltransferase
MSILFDEVFLFGYSPLFVDLAEPLLNLGLRLTVVCGKRQLPEVTALDLCCHIAILCLDKLSGSPFLELGIQQKRALGLSFGAPFIFKQREIDMFNGNILNSHGAPLPQFKGGGGFSWRILQGDKRGSSLVHVVTTAIDEGPIVFRKDFVFGDQDTIPLHYQNTQLQHDREHLLPWLIGVVAGRTSLSSQESERLPELPHRPFQTYFPRLLTNFHAAIDWSWNAEQLQRFVRAFSHPYSGAYSFHRGRKIRFFDCEISRQCPNHPFVHGLVTDLTNSFFEIAVTDGFLRVNCIDFVTDGSGLSLGDRFYTPSDCLESIKFSRAVFSPEGPRLISESPSID